jgi:hypothetical protein
MSTRVQVATFLVLAGLRQRLLGEGAGLFQAAGQQMRLTQGETTERVKAAHCHGNGLFHGLREQRYGISNAPAQGVRRA